MLACGGTEQVEINITQIMHSSAFVRFANIKTLCDANASLRYTSSNRYTGTHWHDPEQHYDRVHMTRYRTVRPYPGHEA